LGKKDKLPREPELSVTVNPIGNPSLSKPGNFNVLALAFSTDCGFGLFTDENSVEEFAFSERDEELPALEDCWSLSLKFEIGVDVVTS
jgi:hypothetical protein